MRSKVVGIVLFRNDGCDLCLLQEESSAQEGVQAHTETRWVWMVNMMMTVMGTLPYSCIS